MAFQWPVNPPWRGEVDGAQGNGRADGRPVGHVDC